MFELCEKYLGAPEADSADQNILPFARFIRQEMSMDWTKETGRK